ncbi:MAG TPA: glycosyltransferase family 4 protein [Candidatus Tumulicola sp.]|jgi:glycosyltransferase involved in cell wall biosynthesis
MSHVVHVADYGNPAPGSFVPSILAVAEDLHQHAGRCSLVSKRVPNAVWYDDARKQLDGFATAGSTGDVLNFLWRAQPDVIHVHFVGWSLPATLAGYLRGTRVIWHLHSAMREGGGAARRLRQVAKYRWFGSGVHKFVVVSDSLRDAMETLGVDKNRVALIRNAVDTNHFRSPSYQERLDARARFGIGERERVVLFFGRDVDIKGADILWRAFDNKPNLTLLGVGMPQSAAGEFSKRVRTIAVPFAEDTAPLYWASDVLAMPSRREGTPFTMLEAFSCGLPIVASNIPALAEVAREGVRATLVPNEPGAIRNALGSASSHRYEETAPARARFGLRRWVDEVTGLYAA